MTDAMTSRLGRGIKSMSKAEASSSGSCRWQESRRGKGRRFQGPQWLKKVGFIFNSYCFLQNFLFLMVGVDRKHAAAAAAPISKPANPDWLNAHYADGYRKCRLPKCRQWCRIWLNDVSFTRSKIVILIWLIELMGFELKQQYRPLLCPRAYGKSQARAPLDKLWWSLDSRWWHLGDGGVVTIQVRLFVIYCYLLSLLYFI